MSKYTVRRSGELNLPQGMGLGSWRRHTSALFPKPLPLKLSYKAFRGSFPKPLKPRPLNQKLPKPPNPKLEARKHGNASSTGPFPGVVNRLRPGTGCPGRSVLGFRGVGFKGFGVWGLGLGLGVRGLVRV